MGLVLVTGYDRYSGYTLNSSGEVAKFLNGDEVRGFRVVSYVFPVSLKVVKAQLPQLLADLRPDLVVGLGMSPTTRFVDVELASVNRVHFTIPDEDSYVAFFEEIVSGGPSVLHTTLPVSEIVSKCSSGVLKVRPSLGTGLYLCNVAAYLIMKYGVENKRPAGFIHLPPSTNNLLRGETSHGYPIDELIEVVKCAIRVGLDFYSKFMNSWVG